MGEAELAALFETVEKGVEAGGCDHSLRFTREWLNKNPQHDADAVVEWLEEHGGYCDCEVGVNAREHWKENRR
jgi:hypothetical protein